MATAIVTLVRVSWARNCTRRTSLMNTRRILGARLSSEALIAVNEANSLMVRLARA